MKHNQGRPVSVCDAAGLAANAQKGAAGAHTAGCKGSVSRTVDLCHFRNRESCRAHVGKAQPNPVRLSPNDSINTPKLVPGLQTVPQAPACGHWWRQGTGQVSHSSPRVAPYLSHSPSSTSERLSRWTQHPSSAPCPVSVLLLAALPPEMAAQGCAVQTESICQPKSSGTLPSARGWVPAPTLLLSL